ncbi:Wzz/FepE/Etk N-terminal domain-containing protein [Croceibacterium sp. TMG7-5b_MA50]|uniref:Wzz/FepE/Etk N-terminal domain-containing protein n=1 Tax=Croceibacterium sp. TMG7-5b_MA50 TaxID=3121290 RepID=UPI003221A5AC
MKMLLDFMNIEQSFPVETANRHRQENRLVAWLRKRRWFALFVILPTLLATVYYGLIASDVYVSESRFVIKNPDQRGAQMSTLASLVQTTGLTGGQEQANEVMDFIRSRDALAALQREIDIRSRFATPEADLFSRFPSLFSEGSFEDLYQFYRDKVNAQPDTETGVAVLKVEAYTPRDAFEINRNLLQLSERLVNQLNNRARTSAIAEAQREVDLATARARTARIALTEYRNRQQLIDPAAQATGVLAIANELVAQRALLQAQLDQMQRLTPDNPSIPALRSQVAAMSAQIASQDTRVVGVDGDAIASKLGGYEDLFVEQEFATQNLTVANAALVRARAEAVSQQYYLERIVDPNMPDMPVLPRRLLMVIIVAAAATCLYFIGWMLIVGILEHAPDN